MPNPRAWSTRTASSLRTPLSCPPLEAGCPHASRRSPDRPPGDETSRSPSVSPIKCLARQTDAQFAAPLETGRVRLGPAPRRGTADAPRHRPAGLPRCADPVVKRWPLYRARLELMYGVWLRRQRRAAESRSPLRSARDAFDALGAIPWSERAPQELRASGERSRRRVVASWDQLSPQELQIAHMAAEGLSNREIGPRLFLSHRTVGFHLYRAFPKLGVTSRGQLHAALDPVSPAGA
jgi:DNA-binding CsgD family transcriptional regulator